jgi:Neprosin
LDRIEIGSQVPDGKIAPSPPAYEVSADNSFHPVEFELTDTKQARGPAGTVPVLRKNLGALHETRSLADYLSKKGGLLLGPKPPSGGSAPPNPFEYFHAQSAQSVNCVGCETWLNVWRPYVQYSGDHSIMQLGMQNYDLPKRQSLEAGWTCDQNLNGDWDPHLFIYYTTNGYTQDGDNIGGYNREVDGWIQVSNSIYPGATLSPVSTVGGPQNGFAIRYQLFGLNWWFWVQSNANGTGEWIGYYPSWLFWLSRRKPFHDFGRQG